MGGRSCSLDQLYKKFDRNDVFPSPKLNEDQKQEKGPRRKLKSFFPEISSISIGDRDGYSWRIYFLVFAFHRNQVKTKQ